MQDVANSVDCCQEPFAADHAEAPRPHLGEDLAILGRNLTNYMGLREALKSVHVWFRDVRLTLRRQSPDYSSHFHLGIYLLPSPAWFPWSPDECVIFTSSLVQCAPNILGEDSCYSRRVPLW